MIVTFADGRRVPNRKNLDDTTFQTLVRCSNKKLQKTLESVIVSCGDQDTDFTMVFTDENGVDTFICNAVPLTANSAPLEIDGKYLPLDLNQSIRVKASVADKISVIAITIDGASLEEATNRYANAPAGANVGAGWRA